jgi:type IV pilus assembly protein PilB
MDTSCHRRPRIGQLLRTQGLISEDQLRIALLEQAKAHQPIGRLLVVLGFISEAALRDTLGESLGQQPVDLSREIVNPAALRLVPQDIAIRHRLLPLDYQTDDRILTIAIADPSDIVAIDRLRHLSAAEMRIQTLLAGESEISLAIDRYYGHELSIDGILQEIEAGEPNGQSLAGTAGDYSQPVVRLIDALLVDAVGREASDIHFEPEASFLRIRYRIDGILRQIRALHRSYWAAMAVRLKVIAGMNIAETRAPQDGRMSVGISGRPVDFRVAAQPTIHGENIVLRILDRQKGLFPLTALGLDERQLKLLRLMMARPEGLILLTGPTGSGKTTTLYSLLNQINSEDRCIMTLEDPVEYPVPLIRQTSIADANKLDFANGIRSMMRQDPDVILVGEIRDAETAVMAFRAAMTGHRVFSTLHTNSAVGAFPRLLDIGIPADILAGNIAGIVAQRLVRRLCPHCRKLREVQPNERHLFQMDPTCPVTSVYEPKGCNRCEFQGYRGRVAIMEVLRMDAELDELVARRATSREIRAAAVARGYRSLVENGLQRVLEGSTSVDELGRVVDLTECR